MEKEIGYTSINHHRERDLGPEEARKKHREYMRIWRAKNPEKVIAMRKAGLVKNAAVARENYKNNVNGVRDRILAKSALQYEINKEKLKPIRKKHQQNNKEMYLAAGRKWKRRNRHKMALFESARRAYTKKATPLWADKGLMTDMYAEASYFGLEIDHIIPLKSKIVCGLHWEGNFQLLTKSENSRKGNRLWIL